MTVISVDYAPLAISPPRCYPTAVHNTEVVGECTGNLISELVQRFGEDFRERIHIIGFSLGAQVAGFAGRKHEGKLKRITGMYIYYTIS